MFKMWGQLPEHAPVIRGMVCGGLLWMPMGRELRVKRAVSTLYAPPDPRRVVASSRWVGSCVLRGLLALPTRPRTRGVTEVRCGLRCVW